MKYYGWHKIYKFFKIKYKTKFKPSHKKTVNIIFNKEDGIGNRIFGLINVINYFSPEEINIFWPNEGWVSAKFFDLFEFKNQNIKEFNDYTEFKKTAESSKNSITIERPACNLKTKKGVNLGLKYNKTGQEDKNELKKITNLIEPSQKVKKIIEKQEIEDYIALQVRNSPDWEKWGRNSDLNNFKDEIKNCPKDAVFYLSAMDKDIIHKINKDNRTMIELKDKDYSSMYDAVADLFMLSKAKKAIYSYGSTFGELAWWLNKDYQEVSIIGNNQNWKTLKGKNDD